MIKGQFLSRVKIISTRSFISLRMSAYLWIKNPNMFNHLPIVSEKEMDSCLSQGH